MRFIVVLTPNNESGGYVASVPLLPGCYSQGDIFEETLENIKEAIRLYLESARAHGEPLPAEVEAILAQVEVSASAETAHAVGRGSFN